MLFYASLTNDTLLETEKFSHLNNKPVVGSLLHWINQI